MRSRMIPLLDMFVVMRDGVGHLMLAFEKGWMMGLISKGGMSDSVVQSSAYA